MKIIRHSNEDEMIACFLNGELFSSRFGDTLRKTVAKLKYDLRIIEHPNWKDSSENQERRHILSEFRNYGKNNDIFENFPKVNKYVIAEFESQDLKNIRYINYNYWNELSNGTGSPLVASKNITQGKIVFNVSNAPFFEGVKLLKSGSKFKPCILLTADYNTFVVLEGHSRITCYAMCPEYFNGTRAIVLECSKNELECWNS